VWKITQLTSLPRPLASSHRHSGDQQEGQSSRGGSQALPQRVQR
jgi:hypothetical protein